MSHPDYHDPLYRELIPTRPSGHPDCTQGPTALWLRLEAERALWDIASRADEPEAGAA